VAESDAMPQSAGEMLRELFGLTPSEVRLALLLGSGEGLAGLAERLGTRLATTRSHLAGALAKTGLHRQAELVRLVERCAAVSRRRA
jgi:DNA-binding CsgD family transcriptional regulator